MKIYLGKYSWENFFYLLSGLVTLSEFRAISEKSHLLLQADWVFPFNFFPVSSVVVFLSLASATMAGFFILALVARDSRVTPFFTSAALILWWVWLAFLDSFGKMDDDLHGYFLVALGMTVAALVKSGMRRPVCSVSYALAALTYMYTASGFWKWRALWNGQDILGDAGRNLPFHIAYGLAEHFDPLRVEFLRFFSEHHFLSACFWLLIIFTQVTVPLAIVFLARLRVPLLSVLVFFHCGAKLIVGPDFKHQIYLLIFFIGVSITARRQFSRNDDNLRLC